MEKKYKHRFFSLVVFLMIAIYSNSQDPQLMSLNSSSIYLNPSFAGDNRFNQTLDLSGNQNSTPDVPDWTQDLILYQMRIDKFGTQPTINSAREKLWVLEKLGITGVVLNPIFYNKHQIQLQEKQKSYY